MAHATDSHAAQTPWAFIALPALAFGAVLWMLLTQELPLHWHADWVPSLGLAWSFRIDGLSALMLLLITGVGTAVFVYAGGYLYGHPQQTRLYLMLSLFMVAMVGCVTADHLLLLFLFWEMTSLTSFMLVGFLHQQHASRRSAQQALLVTGGGGLVLLAGFLLLGQIMGTQSISEIVQLVPDRQPDAPLMMALALILVGAFTKSAQFPFHFWLPNAMSAPTPVSAYLHSATMVKLGVYLLARLDPGFGEWPMWEWTLTLVGSITAAWGMVLALRERDLKRILAWSTVATLGTLVTLIGLRGEGATVAVAALLLAHALYKAPLFFVAGNVDHGTGTRVIDRLGRLRYAMPWTAAAALLAGASMAGAPLSLGFVAKDIIVQAKNSDDFFMFVGLTNFIFGAIAVAVAGVAAVRIFWRHPGINVVPPEAHEGGFTLVAPPLLLAVTGLVLGIFPSLVQDLLGQASAAMRPGDAPVNLVLSITWGPTLWALAGGVFIGLLIYRFWDPLHRLFDAIMRRVDPYSMVSLYETALAAVPRVAAASTRRVQHGQLPGYMALMGAVLVTSLLVLSWPALGSAAALTGWADAPLAWVGACVMVMLGATLALCTRNRFVLLLSTGLVGYGSAVLFLFAGAPDVAFTQFVVETVFVIVVASILLRLKQKGRAMSLPNEPPWRPVAALLALLVGLALALWLWLATGTPFDDVLTRFFAEQSVPAAHGRNVVNVILVDFRALDTLGEITVVMLSALAAWPLLQRLRRCTAVPASTSAAGGKA